jgi:hypothetical protein
MIKLHPLGVKHDTRRPETSRGQRRVMVWQLRPCRSAVAGIEGCGHDICTHPKKRMATRFMISASSSPNWYQTIDKSTPCGDIVTAHRSKRQTLAAQTTRGGFGRQFAVRPVPETTSNRWGSSGEYCHATVHLMTLKRYLLL